MSEATTTVGAARARHTFHPLSVAALEQLTEDSVAITFTVPPELSETFRYRAGQHLTVLGPDGVRRSYSLCDAPAVGRWRIGVKRLVGGGFSEAVVGGLTVGGTLKVMAPGGGFSPLERREGAPGRYVGIAAGSGITPIRAIIEAVLTDGRDSTVTLIYANRTHRSVMFLDEIHDLKDRFPARLEIVHVLSREPRESELFSGRLDADRLGRILSATTDVAAVDEWFLCGPQAMVLEHRAVLEGLGAPGRVHLELFHADPAPRSGVPAEASTGSEGASMTIRLDGRDSSFTLAPDGPPVLDAAQTVRSDVPFACRGGVCGTCRARLVEGSVAMDVCWALEPEEIEAGYVLTCQSHPTSERVVLDYDA